jgi:hypothetical protein
MGGFRGGFRRRPREGPGLGGRLETEADYSIASYRIARAGDADPGSLEGGGEE